MRPPADPSDPWNIHAAPVSPRQNGQRLATPHGIIKAAMANSGKVDGNIISVMVEGRDFKATLKAENLVER